MIDTFCKNLSNTVHLQESNGNLFFQPCCWVPPDSKPIQNKLDLLLSRKHIQLQVHSDTEKYCNQCLSREKFNFNLSHRHRANSFIPEDAKYGDVYYLNVQIDNTCNAACVTCGPEFSSLWEKQLDPKAKLKDFTPQYQALFNSIGFDKLRRVLFAGGEPLLSKHNIEVLKHITRPENVSVSYSTNVGVFPNSELIDLWKSFSHIDINLSIDGTGEQFEYIRWPLSWNKINDNITRYKELESELNISFRVNMTVNPLNIFYYKQLEDWCHLNSLPLHVSPCYGLWGVDSTPLKLRRHIEEMYGSNHRLVTLLEAHPEVNDKFVKLIDNAKHLDRVRGLDHTTIFSDALQIVSR